MNSRSASIIRKEFIQITRDRRTLIIILVIPIIQLFLLGYSATTDIRNVPLAVLDQCRCSDSRQLLDAYRSADYFTLTYVVDSEDEIRRLIEQGAAMAAIGITAVDPAGQPFDPALHGAMAMRPSAGHPPHTVLQVVQRGWLPNGRLLRPARVIVSSAPDSAPPGG